MGYVQTVLGPIDPSELGVTLPHEHTQIALWHVESRWDYWQLTRDEPVILEELERFRSAGGRSLVDLTARRRRTRSGVARGARARRRGLNIVMGSGWYRGAYYPPRPGSTGARSTTWPTSSCARRPTGSARPA